MPDVVDIQFRGCREVMVVRADGTLERYRSPFRSNPEVECFLARVARRAGDSELTEMAPHMAAKGRADA